MPQQLLLTLLLATAICTSSAGQTTFEERRDSLLGYWDAGDTIRYYDCLFRCVKQAAENLKDKTRLLSLLPFIDPDPTQANIAKDSQIRIVAMYFGNRFDREFGDFARVRDMYEIAHAHVQDKILLDTLAWYIENPLGSAYTRLDDFEKALHYYSLTKTAITIGPASHDKRASDWLSRLCANVGTQLWSRQDTTGAIQEFREGLDIALSKGIATGIQANAAGLADIHTALQDFTSAEQFLHLADSALLTIPNDSRFLARTATNLTIRANMLCGQSRVPGSIATPQDCLPAYSSAIATLTEFHKGQRRREVAKVYTAYAHALLQADSLEPALDALALGLYNLRVSDTLTTSLPARRDLYQENTFIELFDAWSRWYDNRYRLTHDAADLIHSAEALSLARHATELIIQNASRDPSKLIAIRTNRQLVARELDRAYTLYESTREPEWLTRARELFSRSKSLLLDEKIKESRIIAGLSDEQREWLRQWQAKLRENSTARENGAGQADSLDRERFHIETEIDQLIAEAQYTFSADTVSGDYIEYALTKNEVYALARLDGRTRLVRLGSVNTFQLLLDRLNEFILLRGASLDTAVLTELFSFLVGPVSPVLPETMTIIPDGPIGFIPFDMLRDDGGRWIVESTAIAYVYSYASPARDKASPGRRYAVYCHAPTYPRQPGRKYDEPARGTFHHLPYAKLELNELRKTYGNRAITSESNIDTDVLRVLPDARIFHYAGHAIANGDSAYLVLGGKPSPMSILTTDELSLARPGPELAVLSACETGLGKLETGEGIRSLGRSFLESGTRAVVMSLWNVYDRTTAGIMVNFHRRLQAGEPVHHALRDAKLDYLSAARHEARSPYFWAGFVAVGDMRSFLNPSN